MRGGRCQEEKLEKSKFFRFDPVQGEFSVEILVDAFGKGEVVRGPVVDLQRVVALPGFEDEIPVRMKNIRINVVTDVAGFFPGVFDEGLDHLLECFGFFGADRDGDDEFEHVGFLWVKVVRGRGSPGRRELVPVAAEAVVSASPAEVAVETAADSPPSSGG